MWPKVFSLFCQYLIEAVVVAALVLPMPGKHKTTKQNKKFSHYCLGRVGSVSSVLLRLEQLFYVAVVSLVAIIVVVVVVG